MHVRTSQYFLDGYLPLLRQGPWVVMQQHGQQIEEEGLEVRDDLIDNNTRKVVIQVRQQESGQLSRGQSGVRSGVGHRTAKMPCLQGHVEAVIAVAREHL